MCTALDLRARSGSLSLATPAMGAAVGQERQMPGDRGVSLREGCAVEAACGLAWVSVSSSTEQGWQLAIDGQSDWHVVAQRWSIPVPAGGAVPVERAYLGTRWAPNIPGDGTAIFLGSACARSAREPCLFCCPRLFAG